MIIVSALSLSEIKIEIERKSKRERETELDKTRNCTVGFIKIETM